MSEQGPPADRLHDELLFERKRAQYQRILSGMYFMRPVGAICIGTAAIFAVIDVYLWVIFASVFTHDAGTMVSLVIGGAAAIVVGYGGVLIIRLHRVAVRSVADVIMMEDRMPRSF